MRIEIIAVLMAGALLGCVKQRAFDGTSDAGTPSNGFAESCSSCHGSAKTPAPPTDLLGRSDPALRGVGAHTSHLFATHNLSRPVACAACHVVPASEDDPGHTTEPWPARVTFSGLAVAGGAMPELIAASGQGNPRLDSALPVSCASVYCHGATLSGGASTSPVWNASGSPDPKWVSCGACHGFPPPSPHPASSACQSCHGNTVSSSDGTAIAHPENHINGVVDVVGAGGACNGCHGNAAASNPMPGDPDTAPPTDTKGGSATSSAGVGAHQAHLKATAAKPVACAECHAVPTSSSHSDGVAQLTFGELSKTGGLNPSFNESAATCSNTWCHGPANGGGTNHAPVWTRVDGSQKACGTCHGIPPPAPHTTSTACSSCHDTVGSDNLTIAKPAQHVDGKIDATGGTSCTSCHGSDANSAPPKDTKGNTATTAIGVGAHQAHVKATTSKAVGCSECHPVPSSMGHSDGSVQLAFGTVSKTGGLNPSFSESAATCSNTWCHGPANGGGTNHAPAWTRVDGSQDRCGTCHGIPPPAPHTTSTACSSCHDTVASDNLTIAKPAQHVNGKVEVTGGNSCNSCHGSDANSAPPKDTKGNTATTAVGVGAHQAHLYATTSKVVGCSECHPVPSSMGHSDGSVQLAFGTVSKTGGLNPSFNESAATCSNTWCHGPANGGGTNHAPAWTRVDGSQDGCGTCHGIPPPAPHTTSTACSSCHDTVGSDNRTIAKPAQHVNGKVDVTGGTSCNSCHGSAANNAPPKDTKGNTATTARGVGAHQAHLQAATMSNPIGCNQCHAVPSSLQHASGSVELAWGALAKTKGLSPSFNGTTCSNTWCHGPVGYRQSGAGTAGGSNHAPTWTRVDGSQDACGTCHGSPPSTGKHGKSDHRVSCGACHPGYSSSSVNKANHMNGKVDIGGSSLSSGNYSNGSCAPSCHGRESW